MRFFFLLFFVCLLVSQNSFSQSRSYNDFIIAASSKTNPSLLVDNFKEAGGFPRFFSDQWQKGYVLPQNGELISEGFTFNYDFEENTLYIKTPKNEIITVNMTSVNRFGLTDGNNITSHFIRIGDLDKTEKLFFEIVAGSDTSDIAIYKSRTVEFKRPDKNDYVRNFQGDYKGSYKMENDYFLFSKMKGYKKIGKLSKKELLSFYPEFKDTLPIDLKKKNKFSEHELNHFFEEFLRTSRNS